MADADPEITIKIASDVAGGERAAKALKKVRGESLGLMGALDRLKSGVERARGALVSMGGVTLVVSSLVKAFKDWSQATVELAGDIGQIKADAAAAALAEIARGERLANEELSRGNALRARSASLDAQRADAARKVQDAEMRAAKARELAAAGTGPDADLTRREIERRYASLAGNRSADRAREDADKLAAALAESAAGYVSQAEGREATAAEYESFAQGETRAASRLAAGAVREARGDAWWKFWSNGAENANVMMQGAARHTAAAGEATKSAESLREEAAALRAKAAAAREEAAAIRENAAAVHAAETQALAAEGALAGSEIGRERTKRAAQRAADAQTVASGTERIAGLRGHAEGVRARAQAAGAANAKEQRDVFEAQQALDLFNLQNRGRHGGSIDRRRAELGEAVVRETNEAQESEAKLKATLNVLATTLKGINDAIAETERRVREATARQKAQQTDAPAGD